MMSLKTLLMTGGAFSFGFATFFASTLSSDQRMPILIRQQRGDLQLEFFKNSETISQSLAINNNGAVIGQKEVANENKTIFSTKYFFCGKEGCYDMPLPEGFTNVEAAALSDKNTVVGRCTKPLGSEGSLRAVVWNPANAEIKLLPTPEGDAVADAQDISADGRLITGYATGPERLRPVVWSWDEAKSSWQVEVLPTIHQHNPYLMSAQLIITPDGKTIVGCCTEKFLEDGNVDSATYKWQREEGKWVRSLVSADQLYLKSINNHGVMVGSALGRRGRLPCMMTLDGKLSLLELLEGDVGGEARDINDQSVIVGWSDDPPGAEGGPVPCQWNDSGKASQVDLSELGYGLLNSINDAGQMAGAADVLTKAESSEGAGDAESAMLAVRVTPKP